MLNPLAKLIPAPQAGLFRGRAWSNIPCGRVRTIGHMYTSTRPSKAKEKENIVARVRKIIENCQKSVPQLIHIGQGNIEDKAEKTLANFEKLSRTLRIPPYQT